MTDRTREPGGGGHFQEYRRPRLAECEQRDDQNRSVQGWVKKGTVFSFPLDVTNLSQIELGALLWLLTLPEGQFFRLGGGKPLGFGSVRFKVTSLDLRNGERLGARYRSLVEPAQPSGRHLSQASHGTEAVAAYKKAVETAYGQGKPFLQVPFIAAFVHSACGFDDRLPIHYPRARQGNQHGPVPPHPEGKAYEWFVANNRAGQNPGPRHALPDLAVEPGSSHPLTPDSTRRASARE